MAEVEAGAAVVAFGVETGAGAAVVAFGLATGAGDESLAVVVDGVVDESLIAGAGVFRVSEPEEVALAVVEPAVVAVVVLAFEPDEDEAPEIGAAELLNPLLISAA